MPFENAFIETPDAFFTDILYDLHNPDLNFGTRWKRFTKLNDYLRGFRRGELTGKLLLIFFCGKLFSPKKIFIF